MSQRRACLGQQSQKLYPYAGYHKAGGTGCTRTLNRSRARILCKKSSHKVSNIKLMIQRKEEVTAAWTQALVALNLGVNSFINTLKWGVKDAIRHGYIVGSRIWDMSKGFSCCFQEERVKRVVAETWSRWLVCQDHHHLYRKNKMGKRRHRWDYATV